MLTIRDLMDQFEFQGPCFFCYFDEETYERIKLDEKYYDIARVQFVYPDIIDGENSVVIEVENDDFEEALKMRW